ncbi:MAG: hypothetical protein ACJZ72_09640 [Opitutales bacterium]
MEFQRELLQSCYSKIDLADRWDLLCKQIVGKYLLKTLSLFLLISLFGCTRVVSLPVRTVVDWTDENTLSTESVYDLSGNTSE